jgi:hypothetical protein
LTRRRIAYSIYAIFEWNAVLVDVAFDAVSYLDFQGLAIVIKDVQGVTNGYVRWLPK